MRDDFADDLTIIAIGSSAGGLEAIRELVATLPANLPVTYVVVQHMSPHHKSLLTELVGRQTDLIVKDVEDGIRPEANVIYITPPRTDVILENGLLRMKPPSELPSAPKPSVDRFLLSLADDHGAKTMAMILSGTGTDGAYGVQAIRAAGGITIAQDTNSAKYDGMPHAAVQTGCVDLVLHPVEIGTHLHKILTSSRDFSEFRKDALQETPVSDLLQILLARTRVDFRQYKQATISRRIERRMTALDIDDIEEYTHFLRSNPLAVDALFKDLLISVTRFFRDETEFEQLRQHLPKLLASTSSGPLRVWIAGCATGEEAYSIAMLISEALGGPDVPMRDKVQIFATDIDKNALQIARAGIYGSAALNDIPRDLATKYLTQHGDGVRVTDHLRSSILFSDHNVCQDPPFQKVHLLCCRNLLIYFSSALQKKVMARFHYSMAADALLFLGTAESVAGSDEMFLPDEANGHIFRKRSLTTASRGRYTMPSVPIYSLRENNRMETASEKDSDRSLFDALIKSLGENSILVAEDGNIIQVNGSISPFIEVNQSSKLKMHLDLLKSPLREEARSLVAIALRTAKHRTGVRHHGINAQAADIRLGVFPIIAPLVKEKVVVVVFNELANTPDPAIEPKDGEIFDSATTGRMRDLENEIAITREALQQTIEQLETSNEELQTLNEELQSTNEELQATNEEMETSNEELQSTNEELITVNEELQITATELSGRTGELASVLQSTPLAIIVTDSALQITQATTAASDLFGLKNPIASPHVSQVKLPEGYPPLAPICSEALRLGETSEHEFSASGTRVFLSCTPFFDVHGKILGLTVAITQFPGLAREMEMILNTTGIHIINRQQDGKILRISESSAKSLGVTRAEAEGRSLFDLMPEDMGKMVREVDRLVINGDDIKGSRTVSLAGLNHDEPTFLTLETHRYDIAPDQAPTIYSIASDVTEVVHATDQTNEMIERFRHLQHLAGFGYWELDPISKSVYWSPKVFELHGVDEEDGEPDYEDSLAFYHPDDVENISKLLDDVSTSGGEFAFNARLVQVDGTEITVRSNAIALTDGAGTLVKIVGAFARIDGATPQN